MKVLIESEGLPSETLYYPPSPEEYQFPRDVTRFIGEQGVKWQYEQARKMREVVEVGCWKGGSTHAICTGCPGPVYAVDHWRGSPDPTDATHEPAKKENIYAEFVKNVGHFENLRVLKMPSVEAATRFPDKSVDMIMIDAGHDTPSVTADLAAWLPKCRKLLCGHDWSHETVRNAVLALGRPVTNNPDDIWSVSCED